MGPGPGKYGYVIQEIEKSFDFSTAPAGGYLYTPHYWEAFPLDAHGQTGIDYWQFDLPDGTSGDWQMSGVCYLAKQLPAGMAVGNVPDAYQLASTTTKPKGLSAAVGRRSIGASFNFTGASKSHT